MENVIGERVDSDEMRREVRCIVVGEMEKVWEVRVVEEVVVVLWSEGIGFVREMEFRVVGEEMGEELEVVVMVVGE